MVSTFLYVCCVKRCLKYRQKMSKCPNPPMDRKNVGSRITFLTVTGGIAQQLRWAYTNHIDNI